MKEGNESLRTTGQQLDKKKIELQKQNKELKAAKEKLSIKNKTLANNLRSTEDRMIKQ